MSGLGLKLLISSSQLVWGILFVYSLFVDVSFHYLDPVISSNVVNSPTKMTTTGFELTITYFINEHSTFFYNYEIYFFSIYIFRSLFRPTLVTPYITRQL